MRRGLIFGSLLILAGIWAFNKASDPTAARFEALPVAGPAHERYGAISSDENVSESPVPPPTVTPEKSILESAPSVETVRDEAARDPHQTPKSLSRFAEETAPRIARAKADPTVAIAVLGELTECVNAAKLDTIRKYCQENKRRLEALYPDLRKQP